MSKNEKNGKFSKHSSNVAYLCTKNIIIWLWMATFFATKVKVKTHVYLRLVSIWAAFLEHRFLCPSVWVHLRDVYVETSRCVVMDTYRTRGYRISSFSVSGWWKKRWKRDGLRNCNAFSWSVCKWMTVSHLLSRSRLAQFDMMMCS